MCILMHHYDECRFGICWPMSIVNIYMARWGSFIVGLWCEWTGSMCYERIRSGDVWLKYYSYCLFMHTHFIMTMLREYEYVDLLYEEFEENMKCCNDGKVSTDKIL